MKPLLSFACLPLLSFGTTWAQEADTPPAKAGEELQPIPSGVFSTLEDGQIILNGSLIPASSGLKEDLEIFDVVKGQAIGGGEIIDKKALTTFLNSPVGISPAFRFSALSVLRRNTPSFNASPLRVHGEIDIPLTNAAILESLRTTDSLPKPMTPEGKSSDRLEEIGRAVGMIVPTDSINQGFDTDSLIALSYGASFNLCAGTQDYETPCVRNSASGFLIKGGRVVTAGHCIDQLGENLSIIFGYTDQLAKESAAGGSVMRVLLQGPHVVVRPLTLIKKPDKSDYPEMGDWAVLKVSGDLPASIVPLEMNEDDRIPEDDQNLVMLGHPCGLPLRTCTKGRIIHRNPNDFMTNLDAFIGNSGSPVFNGKSWKVEGILIEGGKDFVAVNSGGCFEWVRAPEIPDDAASGKAGEKVGRILMVLKGMTH